MENLQGLVEKWEQSGLLQEVKSKETVAQLLEFAAFNLVNLARTGLDVSLEASLTFPIIHKAFKNSDWVINSNGPISTNAVATFVNTYGITDSDDYTAPDLVAKSAKSLAGLLEEKVGTTITNIEIQPRKPTGFFILVHLA